jgi:hypothetical protein
MPKNKGRKREEVIANLLNYPRLKMDLLAAGREDDSGKFPNEETGFLIRKWIMKQNHHGELLEISIPRHCAAAMVTGIDRIIGTPAWSESRHRPTGLEVSNRPLVDSSGGDLSRRATDQAAFNEQMKTIAPGHFQREAHRHGGGT